MLKFICGESFEIVQLRRPIYFVVRKYEIINISGTNRCIRRPMTFRNYK